MEKVNVAGVAIDDISEDQAVDLVKGWLGGKSKRYIVTPNPEFIVAANNNPSFKQLLIKADLAIPDGVGLRLAGLKNTTTGTDLMERLCKESVSWGVRIALLGGRDSVALKAKERLEKSYPGIKIVFAENGPELVRGPAGLQPHPMSSLSLRALDGAPRSPSPLTLRASDIIFVALGMGKQESWIVENMAKVNAKVFMGVGGAFDYLSGQVPRAPLWLRKLGFEWLFRLMIQPWRMKRQLNLLKFLWLLLYK